MQLWTDLEGPRLPWCRLRVLVAHLPVDSAYATATGGGREQWGVAEQLLAHIEHLLELRLWQAGSGQATQRPTRRVMPWEAPQRLDLPLAEMQARLLAFAAESKANRRAAAQREG